MAVIPTMKITKAPSSILMSSFIIVLAVRVEKLVCDLYSKCGVYLKEWIGKNLGKQSENKK
jgi:hypothetical protein